MANLFKKIYTGTLAKYVAATKDTNALYMVYDETTHVKSMYKGGTKISGDFIIVNGVAPTTPEQGVIYYISEFVKEEGKEGKPYVGFYDGTNWIPLSDSATIESLEARIKAIEDAYVKELEVNGVAGTVTTNKATVTIDGADIVVADSYEATVYSDPFEAKASHVAATDKVDAAFKKVETTIGVLVDEVLADEKTNAEAVKALGNAAGTIKADNSIGYVQKTDANYISDATSLHDATVKLDAAIKAAVTGSKVKDGDKILSQDADGIASTLTIVLEKQTTGEGEAAVTKDYVVLKGVGNVEVSKFDASDLVKDSFVDKVEYDATTHKLTITWDTLSGKTPTVIDLSGLVDVTTAEGDAYVSASATNNKVTVAATASTKASLALADTAVQSASGETGDDALVTASVTEKNVGVASSQKLKDAVAAAETAIQSVSAASANQEVTVATDKKAVTIGVTKATYTAATDDKKTNGVLSEGGLIDAAVLKAYVADEIAKNAIYWEELA